MLKIPKNVMQIGTGSSNVKLYMEDYVHTFLERCQGKETCLAFGQQEEKDGIRYYLIYGVEKETDFRRGNFPYFQKLERIGKIEKKEAAVRFWTVRGEEIQIGGYFIFYEQNEEMQAYMIAEREQSRPAAVEEERVMEAIKPAGKKEKRKLRGRSVWYNRLRGVYTEYSAECNCLQGRLRRIPRLAGKRCCRGWVRLKLQRLR